MKVYIKTWGCQMNEYDSHRLNDLMVEKYNAQSVASADQADVILLNTCSIRENPQEKVFSELGRYRNLKRDNPQLKVGVGGCVGSQEGEDILKRSDIADFVFGPQTIHKVPSLLEQSNVVSAGLHTALASDSSNRTAKKLLKKNLNAQRLKLVDTSYDAIEKFDSLPSISSSKVSAFVSIMEGCSKYCTFCIVPFTRGEEVHRTADEIFAEIESLTKQGVREINLLGQNVNAWNSMGHDFAWLIEQIAQMSDINWIRYTTSHPGNVTDSLIQIYADCHKLVSHLHLPVQSGSNKILRDMGRKYTREDYISIVDRLRQARPNIAMSTDIIVGFPGEAQKDFEDTLSLCEKIQYEKSFAFMYSPRPGTVAANLKEKIPLSEAKHRLHQLFALLKISEDASKNAMLGNEVPAMITGFSERASIQTQALSENNLKINIDSLDIEPADIGRILPIKITQILPNSLKGKFVTHFASS